jgi:hypothetical protein
MWRHFTADKLAKTNVTRKISTRKHDLPKRMSNNPLANVFDRTKTSRLTSKANPITRKIWKKNNILTRMFTTLGKGQSTSRVQSVLEVEEQCIEDRFGDVPVYWDNTNIYKS